MSTLRNRRDFFKISAVGALGMTALGSLAFKSDAVDRKSFGVGLQLYTIRDAMTADTLGTLKKLSDLGYKNLELANYSKGKFYGFAPKEFSKIIKDLGMEAISSHSAVESAGITIETAKIMADIPSYHTPPDDAARLATQAGVHYLMFYHMIPPLPEKILNDAFLGDAPDLYSGPITVGRDGMLLSMPAGNSNITLKEL